MFEATAAFRSTSEADRDVARLARIRADSDYCVPERCGTARMAADLGVSASLLCHRFRAAYGMTLGQYVRRRRITKARELLHSPSPVLIKEVAAQVGYRRSSYRTFLNAFRAETGVSPSAYLRGLRAIEVAQRQARRAS